MGFCIKSIVHKDLLPGNQSNTGDDVAVVKVATLSRHAFETPRVGSNPILIPEGAGATDRYLPLHACK